MKSHLESFEEGGGSKGKKKKLYLLEAAKLLRDALRCDGHKVEEVNDVTNLGYASHRGNQAGKKVFNVFPTQDYFDFHFLQGTRPIDGTTFDGIVLKIRLTPTEEVEACRLACGVGTCCQDGHTGPAERGAESVASPEPSCPTLTFPLCLVCLAGVAGNTGRRQH